MNKEAQVWGMNTLGHETRDYQCIKCGKIHSVDNNKTFDLGDDIYYAVYCPVCRGLRKHLDLGEDKDIYYWADPILDERYY